MAKRAPSIDLAGVELEIELGARSLVPEEGLERGGDVQRVGEVALELAVALDPPDDRRVETDAGVEEERSPIRAADADPFRRAARERAEQLARSRRWRRSRSRACTRRRSSNRRAAVRARCRCAADRRPPRSACRHRRARPRRRSRRSRRRARAGSRARGASVSATSTSCWAASSLRIMTRLRAVTDDAVALTRSRTRTAGG